MTGNFRDGLAALIVTESAGLAAAAGVTGSARSDHLNLTNAQRHEIWRTVSKQATKENTPTGFKAMVGETAPRSIKLQALPYEVSSRIPAMKWYDFAMLENQVLIVDPTSMKIVDIVTQ